MSVDRVWNARVCRIAVIWLAAGACANAASTPPPPAAQAAPAYGTRDPLNRDSPQSSVFAFLEACHAKDYQRARRYLDLRKMPDGERFRDGAQLAQQLEKILDRDAQFDVGGLSRNPEGSHAESGREPLNSFSLGGKTVELHLDRVTLHSGAAVWLVSADSVALIPQLARMASDSPIERLLPYPLVSWKLLDTALWRWIFLILLVAALAAVSRLVTQIAMSWIAALAQRRAPLLSAGVAAFAGPLRLLLVVAGFRAGLQWIGVAPELKLYLERGAALFFFSALAWAGMAAVDLGIVHARAALQVKHQTFAYSVLPLVSRVFKITAMVAAAAAVLSNWGYNTNTIVAGLGVGGIAIALAAQKTIENLFGGVAVITDRPVAVGDLCRFGEQVGTVEDIGLRSTRIRTLNRTVLTVPNGQFSSMALENFSKRDKMWFHLMLNLRRDTTSDQVRALLDSITRILRAHPGVETGDLPVRFVGVGTYSLDLEIFAYVKTRDGDEFLRIQQDLFLWILDEVEAAGAALALPTQAYYSLMRGPNQGEAPPAREAPAEAQKPGR